MRTPFLVLLLLPLVAAACGEEETAPSYDRAEVWESLGFAETEAEFDRELGALANVPVDPPPVVGRDYDPVFPDPIPFDPAEWTTNTPSPTVADPRAVRGGTLRLATLMWPPTLRTEGPNARLAFLSDLQNMIYLPLLEWDTVKNEWVPGLATHWQISEDRKTFRFRLDPRARWADGREVTADDVAATFEHLMNEDRQDPNVAQQWQELIEKVTVLDKLTVEIRAAQDRWRNMVFFGYGTNIYPAAYIRMDGETYLSEWNWKLPPGAGPYELAPEDVKKGRSLSIRRKKDWWGDALPRHRGMFNFDRITWKVVRDRETQYHKLRADELDVYLVYRAQRWVEELRREEAVKKGWLQMRKIYTLVPEGYGGYCFNLRQKPFDSLNVRHAFACLNNRELMFAKFFFHQYEYMDSYYPGQPWARPNAERIHYDPQKARELLARDGWTDRDREGYLVNAGGERFPTVTLEFEDESSLRIYEVLRNDLWREAGIRLELLQVDPTALITKQWEKKFGITEWYWTAGLWPDPEFQFHSKYADQPQSNNLNGFKSAEADRIIEAYNKEYDAKKRIRLIQRLDQILFDNHLYALGWHAPFFRVVYWDRLGHPPEYAARYGDSLNNIYYYWWADPEKARRLEENRAANRPSYPDRELNQYDAPEETWWRDHVLPMPEEGR